MKIDLYTKIVLTLIAVALVGIFFRGFDVTRKAYADSPLHVYIEGASSTAFGLAEPIEVREQGTVNVNVENPEDFQK